MDAAIDALDAQLITTMRERPRIGVMELARLLGVARGTAQARLDKLQSRGVITGFGPDVSLEKLGYTVVAFTTIEISQGRLDDVAEHLRQIPEVLEAHAITGDGDLHLKVVARSNAHLQQVIQQVLSVQGITRTTTNIAMTEQVTLDISSLVDQAAKPHD